MPRPPKTYEQSSLWLHQHWGNRPDGPTHICLSEGLGLMYMAWVENDKYRLDHYGFRPVTGSSYTVVALDGRLRLNGRLRKKVEDA